jgi:hypothetical protein
MQKGATHSKIVTLKRAGSDLKLAAYSKALRSTVEERGLQAGLMGRSNFYNVIGCSKNYSNGSLRDESQASGSFDRHMDEELGNGGFSSDDDDELALERKNMRDFVRSACDAQSAHTAMS